jgi:NADPH-dependent ferric siderophore reductase
VTVTNVAFETPGDSHRLTFQVIAVTQLTPRRLRISLVAESPSDFDYLAGDHLKLQVASVGAECEYRHYRITSSDCRTHVLNVEAVMGINRMGDTWAASVVPGEPVDAVADRSPMIWSKRRNMTRVEDSSLEGCDCHPQRASCPAIAL